MKPGASAYKYVIHVVMRWGPGAGGVKQFIHNAVEALPKDEYRQAVASVGPVTGESQELTLLGSISEGDSLVGRHSMRDMVRFFEDESPDVVHVHCNNGVGLLCAEAARRAGRVVRVVHSHNSSLGSGELRKRLADAALKKVFAGAPTARVACSKLAGDWLFADRPYGILKNGIAVGRFSFSPADREAVRRRCGIPEGATAFVLVGAGISVKNAPFAVEVAALLRKRGREAHLMLVGEGEEIGKLRAEVESRGLADTIHFIGTVSDVWRYYSAADALLMPSRHEGLPITLVEAQANGLPCVVSEAVSDEADVAGLLRYLPLGDASEWAGAACEATESGAGRSSASAWRASEAVRAAGFSLDDLERSLVELYEGKLC